MRSSSKWSARTDWLIWSTRAGFVVECNLKNHTQGVRLPFQRIGNIAVERKRGENVDHGHIEESVHDGHETEEEKIVGTILHFSGVGEELAKAGAHERDAEEFLRALVADASQRNDRDPFLNGALAKEGHGLGNGTNFANQGKCGRVEITEQAIT